MIQEALRKLVQSSPLNANEAEQVMMEILEGQATPAQVGAYLSLLSQRGETRDELLGSLRVMRQKMVRFFEVDENVLDVCGTGGDHAGTFNISTASAIVLAGGGVRVVKHGNRAASSQCGSAEILQTLGFNLDAKLEVLHQCLVRTGITFLFAPNFHPAMKSVATYRKEIGIRSIFNLLGPLANPAQVKKQLVGVFDASKAQLLGEVLIQSGSRHILTLHSEDGLDEVSCAGMTRIFEYQKQEDESIHKKEWTVEPATFGFSAKPLSCIQGYSPSENAKILLNILKGEISPYREVVISNAALGFYLSGKGLTLKEGVKMAQDSLDSQRAYQVLQHLIETSQS